MKKGCKSLHPSMVRSKLKRKGWVNTRPVYDPFLQKLIYINKNGRVVRI